MPLRLATFRGGLRLPGPAAACEIAVVAADLVHGAGLSPWRPLGGRRGPCDLRPHRLHLGANGRPCHLEVAGAPGLWQLVQL
eukprot:7214703-Pyramimonas_sp.AAC.1